MMELWAEILDGKMRLAATTMTRKIRRMTATATARLVMTMKMTIWA
jgi:hypothetical protein